MILIVCGMDRCGKSTLISNLRKHYFTNPKLIVHHASSPPKGVLDQNEWEVDHYREVADTFHHLSAKEGYDIICDRFHLGAIVYGTRYRGLNPYTIINVDAFNISRGHEKRIALVLLTDNTDAIMTREDGNSLETTAEEYDLTRKEFIKAAGYSAIPHKIHINITDNGGFENTYPAVAEFLDNVRGEHAKSC
jgi:thymidylate kinase